jgi:hypothetical protein
VRVAVWRWFCTITFPRKWSSSNPAHCHIGRIQNMMEGLRR